jgi:uncharacterized caspase-like protein
MTLEELKTQVKAHLRESHLEEVFELLFDKVLEDSKRRDELLIHRSSWSAAKKENNLGLISHENFTMARARTVSRLQDFIKELKPADVGQKSTTKTDKVEEPMKHRDYSGYRDEPEEKPMSTGQTWFVGIGIDEYAHWPNLNNAVRDMEAVSRMLAEEYDVQVKAILRNKEASLEHIIDLFERLCKELKAPDNVIIYYSGHGHIDPSSSGGFLVPSDARKSKAGYIRNSTLRDYFNDIGVQHLLFISDACFSGSLLVEKSTDAEEMLLSELAARPSRWVMCSGRHDEAVSDGPKGGHSPFADALLKELRYNQKTGIHAAALAQAVQLASKHHYKHQLADYGPVYGVGDARGQLVLWRRGEGNRPHEAMPQQPATMQELSRQEMPQNTNPMSPSERQGIETAIALKTRIVNSLRTSLVMEDDPSRKIKYEVQLEAAEAELNELKAKLT